MALNVGFIANQRGPKIEVVDPLQDQANAIKLRQLVTGEQEDQAQREALRSSAGDSAKYLQALASGGNYKAYQAAQKAMLDAEKTRAEVGETKARGAKLLTETESQKIAQHRDSLAGVNDPQTAAQWVISGYKDPTVGPRISQLAPLEQALSRIPTDPAGFQQWKQQQALGATKYIELNKPKYETRNLGGTTETIALPGLGGAPTTVSTMRNTQSPDSIASTGLGYSRLNFEKAKDARDQSAVTYQTDANGNIVALPAKLAPGAPVIARPALDASGQPLSKGGAAKMTEDQGKATGWLIQAENAFNNMKKAGFDEQGNPKSSAYPGVNDALAVLPGGAPLANMMRTADRQKFIQSASSLSEALLRAATGAGVNESEAKQKIAELTPGFGESAETTKQKMEAIPLYLESLRVRAGPGAKQAQQVLSPAASGIPDMSAIDAEIARRRGGKK